MTILSDSSYNLNYLIMNIYTISLKYHIGCIINLATVQKGRMKSQHFPQHISGIGEGYILSESIYNLIMSAYTISWEYHISCIFNSVTVQIPLVRRDA